MRHATLPTACFLLLAVSHFATSGQDQGKQDKAKSLASAPKGYDAKRDGIEHGKMETVEYESKVSGGKRKMVVYTPPGYSKANKYPVLYLLHGIGGDHNEWPRGGVPNSSACRSGSSAAISSSLSCSGRSAYGQNRSRGR